MTTHIVIPVRDQIQLTQDIVEQIERQSGWDKCWIFDNGSVDNTLEYLMEVQAQDSRFAVIMASGVGIYDMWNQGFSLAKHEGADYVAILNNDLRLAPYTFDYLNYALDHNPGAWIAYPNYDGNLMLGDDVRVTTGTYRHGGMSGFCFMLRANCIDWDPLVDPIFKWWGGDDDIAFEVEKRGGQQIRVMRLGIQHFNEGTAVNYDLGVQKGLDMQAIFNKWGR